VAVLVRVSGLGQLPARTDVTHGKDTSGTGEKKGEVLKEVLDEAKTKTAPVGRHPGARAPGLSTGGGQVLQPTGGAGVQTNSVQTGVPVGYPDGPHTMSNSGLLRFSGGGGTAVRGGHGPGGQATGTNDP